MTAATHQRLVLVVATDSKFAEDCQHLLPDEGTTLIARSVEDAAEIVADRQVDLALLGPSFGNEAGIRSAGLLREIDPSLKAVLIVDIVTNRILLAALRSGLLDVVDTPLTEEKVSGILERAPRRIDHEGPAVLENDPIADEGSGQAPAEAALVLVSGSPARSTRSATLTFELPRDPSMVLSLEDVGAPVTGAIVPVTSHFDVSSVSSPAASAADATTFVEPENSPSSPPAAPVEHGPAFPSQASARPGPSIDPIEPDRVVDPAVETDRDLQIEEDDPVEPVGEKPDDTLDELPVPPAFEPSGREPIDLEQLGVLPADGPDGGRSTGPGRVVAVMAGKGGSGKTITVTNLALALAEQHGDGSVAVVDADLQFGDVALMLELAVTHTLDEAVARIDELSDDRLDELLLRHASGLRVLAAPLRPSPPGTIPAKSIVEIIERLRGMYAVVVVDTASVFDDHLVTLLESADDVLVVVDMDVPSVKNTKVVLEALRAGSFPMDRVRLVVNRSDAKARLDPAEMEQSLGLRVAGSIPSHRLIPQAVNEGVPVVALKPRSKPARAFLALADLLELPEPRQGS